MRWPSPRPRLLASALAGSLLLLAGCADFSEEQRTFTVQPSLTAPAAEPQLPSNPAQELPPLSDAPPSEAGPPPPSDPCAPTDEAVIATCLTAPWGLAPLPDGTSALVGERTTGRILQVARGVDPVEVARLDGVDGAGDGGLLGIVLSPSYVEDHLIYAYVTTPTDNRIVRIAPGDAAKPIFTGVPRGAVHNGGRMAFADDRTLYVGTGDTGDPAAAADPLSLSGKVLRLDEFGKPSASNPTAGSPIYASGFTQITGMCPLDDGTMAALDARGAQDLLLPLEPGGDYSRPEADAALWTWTRADGGAADCAVASGILANTSLDKEELTVVRMSGARTFSGSPVVLLDDRYGRLLTVADGEDGLLWATTSNKDGIGDPVPSDDRVVIVPTADTGGEGGPD